MIYTRDVDTTMGIRSDRMKQHFKLIRHYVITGMLALLLFAPFAAAGNGTSTGMQFLLTGPSAHNMGASDSHTATLTGASAIYLNPSLLAMEPQSSATLSFMLWPATDTRNSFAGINWRRDNDAIGIALLSSLVDDIEFRSRPAHEPDGLFAVSYFSLAGSYARRTGPLSIGITGMYLYEQFFDFDASGYGLTAGLSLNTLDERIRYGVSLRNLGSMQALMDTPTELPTLLNFGTDIRLIQFSTTAVEDEIPLLVSIMADYNIPLNEPDPATDESIDLQDDGYLNAGLEINISELIDLRAGYRTGDTQRRFNFGAGLRVNELYFNYAFMPYETGFGVAHAISAQYYF